MESRTTCVVVLFACFADARPIWLQSELLLEYRWDGLREEWITLREAKWWKRLWDEKMACSRFYYTCVEKKREHLSHDHICILWSEKNTKTTRRVNNNAQGNNTKTMDKDVFSFLLRISANWFEVVTSHISSCRRVNTVIEFALCNNTFTEALLLKL